MLPQVTKDVQPCCLSCELHFQQNMQKPKLNQNSVARDFLALQQSEISDGKGEGETQGVMSCSSLTVPSAHATNCMQDMGEWNTAAVTCQSVLPGITSATELTVTLHQPPASCQVSTSSDSGKINSEMKSATSFPHSYFGSLALQILTPQSKSSSFG